METPSSTGSSDMVNDYSAKVVFFSNEFPNDDLREMFRRLYRHGKDKRFRNLALFLEECTSVVKEESLKLPQQAQDLIPPFESIAHLADHGDFRQGCLGAAMESVILCVLEVGMLIGSVSAL